MRGGSYYQGEPSARGSSHYYQPDSPSAGTSVKPGSSAEPAPPPHMNISIEEPGPEYFDWGVWLSSYPKKFKGGLDTSLPFPPLSEVFWSWLGAFLGILAVSALNQWVTPEIDIALMVSERGVRGVQWGRRRRGRGEGVRARGLRGWVQCCSTARFPPVPCAPVCGPQQGPPPSPRLSRCTQVGSFGASAVLVFGMLESKMAQPRNFVGGQLIR